MVNYRSLLISTLRATRQLLFELRSIFASERNDNSRITIALYDIDTTISNCDQYINNEGALDVEKFRFDMNVVKLIDTIQYNDFGGAFNAEQEHAKQSKCAEIFHEVENMNAIILAEKNRVK